MNTSIQNKLLSIISLRIFLRAPYLFVILLWFSGTSLFANLMQNMTLEEKVGQLLMTHFHGDIANDDAKTLIQKLHVGGIIYYNWSNTLSSKSQVKALSVSLQNLTFGNRNQIPLLIAVDQEGGKVARLKNGFTTFPGNRALGDTKNPALSRLTAITIGEELKSVGINMNLSPVIDIDSNPNNPVIGSRSFGNNPEIVIAFGFESLMGYREAGIISTLKHFPGHGDTKVDSHETMPVIDKTLKQLEEMELLPFRALSSYADVIMTAHLLVPAFDKDYCSTLSEKTLNYLKNTIGFKGIIISDSLVMEGVLKKCDSIEEAAILAFNAGCDIILLGGKQLTSNDKDLELSVKDIEKTYRALVDAVNSGRISETRVDQSVAKILELKTKFLN